jgi:putative endonuclease
MKFYYTYVLLSLKDHKFYMGYSEDVFKRLKAHNKGDNASTKNRRPLELIYFEAFRDKKDALRREKYFKTTKGKTTLRQMMREFLHD